MRKIFIIKMLALVVFICVFAATFSDAQESATSTLAEADQFAPEAMEIIPPLLESIGNASSTQEFTPPELPGDIQESQNEMPIQDTNNFNSNNNTGNIGDVSLVVDNIAPQSGETDFFVKVDEIIENINTQVDNFSAAVAGGENNSLDNATSTVASFGELVDGLAAVLKLADTSATSTQPAVIDQPARILALWQMTDGGLDAGTAPGAQIDPSGEFAVDTDFMICGAVFQGDGGRKAEAATAQIFYPVKAGFGQSDAKARSGCGQNAANAAVMEKLSADEGIDLLCEKIQKNNANLPQFAEGFGYTDLCGENGGLAKETAAVYCAGQKLAYDDVPGDYAAVATIKNITGDYQDKLEGVLAYLPLAKINIDFTNVYYGTVRENVEAVADFGTPKPEAKAAENVTKAVARNTGNVPARLSLWQDDMGLGQTEGVYNIRYGARISGVGAAWTNYNPWETAVMPAVIDPGQAVEMDFSVKVLNFPTVAGENKINYSGKMKVDAVASSSYECIK